TMIIAAISIDEKTYRIALFRIFLRMADLSGHRRNVFTSQRLTGLLLRRRAGYCPEVEVTYGNSKSANCWHGVRVTAFLNASASRRTVARKFTSWRIDLAAPDSFSAAGRATIQYFPGATLSVTKRPSASIHDS